MAWDELAAQRDAEIERGGSSTVSGPEVLARLRAELARPARSTWARSLISSGRKRSTGGKAVGKSRHGSWTSSNVLPTCSSSTRQTAPPRTMSAAGSRSPASTTPQSIVHLTQVSAFWWCVTRTATPNTGSNAVDPRTANNKFSHGHPCAGRFGKRRGAAKISSASLAKAQEHCCHFFYKARSWSHSVGELLPYDLPTTVI